MQLIKSTLAILFKSNFTKLISALFLAQIINFGFSLLLPRFFSPQQFATFGVFTSIVFIAVELINLKLDVAVQLPKEDSQAKQLLSHAISIAFVLSFFIGVISIFISIKYSGIYVLLPLVILSYGIYQPIFYWLNRTKQVAIINNARIAMVLMSPVIALLIAVFSNLKNGLIIGFVLAQFIVALYLFFYLKIYKTIKFTSHEIALSLSEFNQFPKYGVLSSVLNSISKNIIIPLIQFLFGSVLAGSYTLATRVLQAPVGMYTTAMGQIYYSEAAHKKGTELKLFTKQVAMLGFLLALIPSFVLLFFGKSIIVYVFGDEWISAGLIAQYIVLWYALSLVVQPISFLIDIKQKLKFELKWNTLLLLCRVAAIVVGYFFNDFYLAISLTVLISIVFNIYMLYYVFKIANE